MSSVIGHEAWRARLVTAAREKRVPAGSARVAWGAAAVLVLAAGALLWHLTRGTTFWFDEWIWVTGRRASNTATFLTSYNGHFSLVPVALYKLLFATAGTQNYGAYRAMIIAGHLVCVVLLFRYARARVGDLLGLLSAALLAFLGPGWQNILWPFQVAWLLVVAAAIGALMLLDRRDRVGDVATAALLMLALASQSIGLAVVAGVAVEIAVVRRRWRDAWIVLVPLAIYAVWWQGYQDAQSHGSIGSTVVWVAESAAASLSTLFGLSGVKVQAGTDSLFTFGSPLAVAGVVLIGWLWRTGRVTISPRVLTIGAMLLAYWISTGLGRSDITPPTPSRYLYVDAMLVLLLAIELARGARVGPVGRGLLALGTLAAVVSNFAVMRDAAAYLRGTAQAAGAEVAAINLSRPFVRPGVLATSFPGYPFLFIYPGDIYAAEADLGPTGDTLAQLAAAPAQDRAVADNELVHLRALALKSASAQPPASAGGTLLTESVVAGSASARQGCVEFRAGPAPAGVSSSLDVRLSTHRVWIAAADGAATVGVRRFGDQTVAVGTIPGNTFATLAIPADPVPQPWHLQLASPGRLTVCSA